MGVKQAMTSNRTDYTEVLKYPLNLLTACGCFVPLSSEVKLDKDSPPGRDSCHSLVSLYRAVVVLVHLISLVRNAAFEIFFVGHFSTSLSFYILWYLFLSLGSSLYLTEAIVSKFHFRLVLDALQEYSEKFGFRSDLILAGKLSKYGTIFFIVASPFYHVVINSVFMFLVDEPQYFMYPFEQSTGLKFVVIGYAFTVLTSVIYLAISGFIMVYSALIEILNSEFNAARDEMFEILLLTKFDSATVEEQGFLRARDRHRFLRFVSSRLSKQTRMFTVVCLSHSLALVFFITYALGSGMMSGVHIIHQVCILGVALFIIIYICVRWGRLPSAAQSITNALTEIALDTKPAALIQKIHLFLSECSITKPGIDLYGMFTLDSSTIVMMFGTIVTYGIIVLQFQLDKSSPPSCQCHSNTTLI